MSELHSISGVFTNVDASRRDPAQGILSSIASLEKQLKEKWEEYFRITENKSTGITQTAVDSIQKKYPFMRTLVPESGGNHATITLRNMPMRFARSGASTDNLNEDVIFVTSPVMDYSIKCSPTAVRFTNMVGTRSTVVSLDYSLRCLEGFFFSERQIEALRERSEATQVFSNPRNGSEMSHPHSGRDSRDFSDICFGTNRFHPAYGGADIQDGDSFAAFLLGMMQWISTANTTDMYNRSPVPVLDSSMYRPGLITKEDVTAAADFLSAAKPVVQSILLRAAQSGSPACTLVTGHSDHLEREYSSALHEFLSHFENSDLEAHPTLLNPAAILVGKTYIACAEDTQYKGTAPAQVFAMLNSAYLILYMKALGLGCSHVYDGRSSMEYSLYYSVFAQAYTDKFTAEALREESLYTWYPPEFIQQWYESPAMFARRAWACDGSPSRYSDELKHVLRAMEYTQPGSLLQ